MKVKNIVIFKRRKQCEKTANKIRNDKFPRRFKDANGTLCYENCTRAGKYFSTTLNLEGLKWVSTHKTMYAEITALQLNPFVLYVQDLWMLK